MRVRAMKVGLRIALLASCGLAACTDFDALTRDYEALDALAPDLPDLSVEDGAPVLEDLSSTSSDLMPVCDDGIVGAGESDVDCGGGCGACEVGSACFSDGDCLTSFCDQGRCELVSGPPGWLPVGTPPTAATSPPIARYDFVLARGPDNVLYAMGGRDHNDDPTDYVDKLDEALTWSVSPDTQRDRARPAGTASATAIWLLYGEGSAAHTSVERMQTSSTFTLATGLTATRLGAGAAVGSDEKIYFYGGTDGTTRLRSLHAFAATDTSFSTLKEMSTARERFGATAGADGRLYAIGGIAGDTSLSSVEAYTIATDTWASVVAMPEPRGAAPAVLAPDGRIYLAGGTDLEAGRIYQTAVAFRAAGKQSPERWAKVASLAGPRWRHGAAVGADGRIYVVGGSGVQSHHRGVEAYGPLVSVQQTSVAAGGTVQVSGSNFARNAKVAFSLGSAASAVIGMGTTDGVGVLPSTAVVIPAGTAAAATRLYATDARSRYPVSARLTVTP